MPWQEKPVQFDPNNAITRGSVQVDLLTFIGKWGERTVRLSPREIDLIAFMHGTFTKKDLCASLYQTFGERISEDAVGDCLSRLRKKLGEDVITTIRRGEFRLNDGLPKKGTQ